MICSQRQITRVFSPVSSGPHNPLAVTLLTNDVAWRLPMKDARRGRGDKWESNPIRMRQIQLDRRGQNFSLLTIPF